MRLTLSSVLIALLLSVAASSLACGPRAITPRAANLPPNGSGGAGDDPLPAGWKRYDFQKPLSFSLILPVEPEQRVKPLLDGAESSHAFISAGNSGVYGATYISDLTAVARLWESSGNELLYELFIKEFAAKMAGGSGGQGAAPGSEVRFTADRQAKAGGLEGLERDFSLKDFRGRMRVVRVGQAGFCLVAIWTQDAPAAEREAFFDAAEIAAE